MDTKDTNGIRVVIVMNRKGGCGKSTLVKGLASAAAARGESVTVFDTDTSESTYQWMLNGKEKGNWSGDVSVIKSMSSEEILSTIDSIYEMPDQEHLILIDTFGGASDAIDEMTIASHFIAVPSRLSRSDVTETMQTLLWHQRLKDRVEDATAVPPARVIVSAVPTRRNEAEEAAIDHIFGSMPAITEPIIQRAAYLRMDLEGLLGPIRDNITNRRVAKYIGDALNEMTTVLDEIDSNIKAEVKANG